MATQIKNEDLRKMLELGRTAARTRTMPPIREAAQYLAMAANEHEIAVLRGEFEQGSRNVSTDQEKQNQIMWNLNDYANYYRNNY